MFLWIFFSEKDDFVREKKNCAARKKYSERSSEESNNTSITGQPRG
jgi:hypothetical protein